MQWIKGLSWAARIAILAAVLALLWTGWVQFTGGQRAKIENRINANQVEAATQSGADAVETLGNQGAAEAAVDDLTRSNDDEIRTAEGADAPVADPAAAAGLRSLCRRAAYRDRPECLQYAPAE